MNTLQNYSGILTALCIWREARGCERDAMRGVYHVIANRTKDSRKIWPKSMIGVILQPWQFSSFNKNDPNATKMPGAVDSAFEQCCDVVDSPGEDNTHGATLYHSFKPGDPGWPNWAKDTNFLCQIGPFRFYKG